MTQQDVAQVSKSEFARFFKENLEKLTGLCFEDCQEVSGGMAVFGNEGTIKALWASPEWSLHTRDLDFDPDYGWNLVISS